LIKHSDGVYINLSSVHGSLMQLPKLYLHIGAKATSSTEILSKSLVKHLNLLNSDNYRVAVHGEHNPTLYDFPNVDRLGSCMWSDPIKSSFPDYMREARICPHELLPDLSRYMENAAQDHQDMVILNPWLSRRGTADSLALFLDPVWEVRAVIYYRRYYEWITIVHDEWRSEILQHAADLDDLPFSTFRYIDFIREYNKRLFYGKNVDEDGYPIRPLVDNQSQSGSSHDDTVDHFDPTSNVHVEDLTDLTEYTYFVAKEYSSNPRFRRHLTIVNYHASLGIETNFYCHVLHDAHNACRAAAEQESGRVDVEFAQTNAEFPIQVAHVAEDLVIAALRSGRIFDPDLPKEDIPLQLLLWVNQVQNALEHSGKLVELPVECLYSFEVGRLLEVSLAYEKSLLPIFYDSMSGATDLVRRFHNWQFCSVDTDKVLSDAQWNFLFDFTSRLFDHVEPV
jgi:hypothetical protein